MPHDSESTSLSTHLLIDFTGIEELYKSRLQEDFASNELRPLSSLRRSWMNSTYDCYVLSCAGEILGYAFFVRLENNFLLDYFAIEKAHRGKGLGSVFLSQLKDLLAGAASVVIEVEDPCASGDSSEKVLRERRLQFYLRNGCRETELTSKVFGADYRILEIPVTAAHTSEKLRSVYTSLYKSILPSGFFHTQFRVNPEKHSRPSP